jgi:hypothetical protein
MAEVKTFDCYTKLPRVVKFAFTDYKVEKNSLSAKCKLCTNKTTVISDKCGTTSNFIKHLERKHNDR